MESNVRLNVTQQLQYRSAATPRLICFSWIRIAGPLGRMLTMALSMALLAFPLFADGSVSNTLMVQARPEATLSRQGETTVVVKIRLAPATEAALWRAKNCGIADAQAFRISRSGTYAIPVSAITGVVDGDTCLASTDGVIVVSLQSPSTSSERGGVLPLSCFSVARCSTAARSLTASPNFAQSTAEALVLECKLS